MFFWYLSQCTGIHVSDMDNKLLLFDRIGLYINIITIIEVYFFRLVLFTKVTAGIKIKY